MEGSQESQFTSASKADSNLSDRDEDALGDVSDMIDQNESAKSITGGLSLPSVDDPLNAEGSQKSLEEKSVKSPTGLSEAQEGSAVASVSSSSLKPEISSAQNQSPGELGSDKSLIGDKSTVSVDQESLDQSVRSSVSGVEEQSGEQASEAFQSAKAMFSQKSGASEIQSERTPEVSQAQSMASAFGSTSQTVETESLKSGESPLSQSGQTALDQSAESVSQMLNDEDALEETLDHLSKKEDSLDDQLNKLEALSNVGQLDEEEVSENKSAVSAESLKSPSTSQPTFEQQSESLSMPSETQSSPDKSQTDFGAGSEHLSPVSSPVDVEEVDHQSPDHSELLSEPAVGMERSHFSQPSQKDIETVITDEDDKPLTEQDKEIILDELEGKPVKADLHINHKSIESLHHINVYHYLPPKFIAAGSMPYGYPGMPQQPQQQMTPGPIINIHNSTTSSGGGTNNAYDVGSDGKLHSEGGAPNGQVIVSNPAPAQNWGQVVYSNSHRGVHSGAVSTIAQPLAQTQAQPMTPMNTAVNQPMAQPTTQTPLTLESVSPEVINEKPIVSAENIKVEPIVNSEVINKSPINNIAETQEQPTFGESEASSTMSADKEEESFLNQSPQIIDQASASQDLESGTQDLGAPSELSDFDEESVVVDPEKVNDQDGQSVTLGEEGSEQSFDDKSILII